MTDEGWQLQQGLIENGFEPWGKGFENDSTDVAEIVAATKPDIAVVIDKREWDASMRGAFDKAAEFRNINALADRHEICKITVCKDAASVLRYQEDWANELRADGFICYYGYSQIGQYSRWISPKRYIRTRHSVDAARVPALGDYRGGAMVSGARNKHVYPFRETCFRYSEFLGVKVQPHPGYHNCGTCTPHFLDALATWKVHLCCASRYDFLLRKIIESVACGCTVITDLKEYVPEIDGALIRVPTDIAPEALKPIIKKAIREWSFDSALEWSAKAKSHYDYHVAGARLSDRIDMFYRAWQKGFN